MAVQLSWTGNSYLKEQTYNVGMDEIFIEFSENCMLIDSNESFAGKLKDFSFIL